jgi:hypothetical protein
MAVKHRPGNGDVGRGGTAVPDAALADVEAGKLPAPMWGAWAGVEPPRRAIKEQAVLHT